MFLSAVTEGGASPVNRPQDNTVSTTAPATGPQSVVVISIVSLLLVGLVLLISNGSG